MLADERDVGGLAFQIESLMLNSDLGHALAKEGQRRVAEHFDAEKQDAVLFQMIERLCLADQ